MKRFSSTLAFKAKIHSQGGFTLLEILIAIALLAFITIGVVEVTENALNTKERTTAANENNLQAETAFSRFEWDFSQIYSPLYFSTVMNLNPNVDANGNPIQPGANQPAGAQVGTQNNPILQQYYENLVNRLDQNEHFLAVSKEGLPIPRFHSPEKNVFEFFTSSNRRKMENTKQSHFAWVRYSLGEAVPQGDDEERNPGIPQGLKSLVRYFSADDPYDPKRINIDDAKVKGSVLLENVESLEFQYWDYQRKKWENNLRTIAQGESLIRGVRMLITWYDSAGNKRTAARTFRNHWPMVVPQDDVAPINNRPNPQGNPTGGNTVTDQDT